MKETVQFKDVISTPENDTVLMGIDHAPCVNRRREIRHSDEAAVPDTHIQKAGTEHGICHIVLFIPIIFISGVQILFRGPSLIQIHNVRMIPGTQVPLIICDLNMIHLKCFEQSPDAAHRSVKILHVSKAGIIIRKMILPFMKIPVAVNADPVQPLSAVLLLPSSQIP